MRSVSIREILQAKSGDVAAVVAMAPDATVYDAICLLADRGIGSVLVMDGERLVGIVSERDCVRKISRQDKNAHDVPVSQIMAANPVTASPEDTVWQAMNVMNEKRFRHLPVLEGERVVGMISIGDLVKTIMEEQEKIIRHLEGYITGGIA
ncbi:MAG: CBS domain-containing protein [Leptospirales bacterium]|nr:CBS domain-containing protein [Leptospirales bacterium]